MSSSYGNSGGYYYEGNGNLYVSGTDTAVGIYTGDNSTITNLSNEYDAHSDCMEYSNHENDSVTDITIYGINVENAKKAVGIYAGDKATVNNGFYNGSLSYYDVSGASIGYIHVSGTDTAFGIYAGDNSTITNSSDYSAAGDWVHDISVRGAKTSVGIYAGNKSTIINGGTADGATGYGYYSIVSGTDKAVGIYAGAGSTVTNYGEVVVNSDNIGIGIYAGAGSTVTNKGSITVNSGNIGIGIYAESGATIVNEGTIYVTATNLAIGVYSEAVSSGETETGSISTDWYGDYVYIYAGDEGTAYGYYAEYELSDDIISNINQQFMWDSNVSGGTTAAYVSQGDRLFAKGKLIEDGSLISDGDLNLDELPVQVVATQNATISAQSLSGTLVMAAESVSDGFATAYTTTDTISADSTAGLNLLSQSALFEASLAENGKDVNLTMKSFADVVENSSLAEFLQNNYAAENNESLFKSLKAEETVASLNDNLDRLFGKEMFSRFADENLTALRELSFDMNDKLFNNTQKELSIGGSTSSLAISGNSRYSLSFAQNGKSALGVNVAFSDINSNDGHKNNSRVDKMYNIGMPMGYRINGFNLLSTPRIGYAYGTYDRLGIDNQNYDGKLYTQMLALMNEARYPLKAGSWNIAPSAELNLVNYRFKGEETARRYSLNIKEQNTYSLEAGVGLYADKQLNVAKDGAFKLSAGVGLYHEFADPYKIKVGMNEMDGTFVLRDENRTDNRAVARFGVDFNYKDFSLSGKLMSYIDRELRTNAVLDLKYGF
jgi:hypothetical protein